MKTLVMLISLSGLISASLFVNSGVDNLSTLAHIANSQNEGHHHTHSEVEGAHHNDRVRSKKTSSMGVYSVTHSHDSADSNTGDNEPHEHHLSISPSFVAFVANVTPFDFSKSDPSVSLSMEPDHLISGLFKVLLFRPPIS